MHRVCSLSSSPPPESMVTDAAQAADAAERVAREAAVKEGVWDWGPNDGLMIDVDSNWNWQRQWNGREAKSGR